MNNRARNTLMLMAAGYIIYTGVMLVKNAAEDDVSSNMMFIIIGIMFTIFGIVAFISYGKAVLRAIKEDKAIEENVVEENAVAEEKTIIEEDIMAVADTIESNEEHEEINS